MKCVKSALTNERVCELSGAVGTLAMSFCELVHYVVVFPSKVPSIVTAVRVLLFTGRCAWCNQSLHSTGRIP